MKTKYKIVAALCLIILSASCIEDWSVRTNSYVLSYNSLERIEATSYSKATICIYGKSGGFIGSVKSTDRAEKEAFFALCEKYGDTSYNRKLKTGNPNQLYYRYYFAEDFSSVRITSRSDFDDEHPAGTPLNDLFHFVAASPYRYIQRGYTDEYDWSDTSGLSRTYKNLMSIFFSKEIFQYNPTDPIDKRVDELEPDDLKLLGFLNLNYLCYLVCLAEPTLEKEHEFLIVFYGYNNNNYVTRVTVQF